VWSQTHPGYCVFWAYKSRIFLYAGKMIAWLWGWIVAIVLLQSSPSLWPASLILTVIGVCIGGVCVFFGSPQIRILAYFVIGFSCGWSMALIRAEQRVHVFLPAELENISMTVTVTVVSLPQLTPDSIRFLGLIREPKPSGLPELVSLSWYYPKQTKLAVGQTIQAVCRLKAPHGLVNPAGMNIETWLWSQGIRVTGTVKEVVKVNVSLPDLNGYWKSRVFIEQQRSQVRTLIYRILGQNPFVPVIVALIVGDQSGISRSEWQLFWVTGVGHLMSISGLHITMMAGVAMFFARWLGLSLFWRGCIGLSTALAYSVLAGFSTPTQRTFFMLGFALLARQMNHALSGLQILLLALSASLLLDPWAVLSVGFWLSYGAVAALVLSGEYHYGVVAKWRSHVHSQWVATVALFPLLVLLFGQVSLVAPLANMVAIPVVSLGVVPLAFLGLIPGLSVGLKWSVVVFGWVEHYLNRLSEISWANWLLPEPHWSQFLLGMMGLMALLCPRGWPGRYWGLVALAGMINYTPPRPPFGAVWLTVLDVGQGLSVVIRTHNHQLVVDTGPSYGHGDDTATRVVLPYLHSLGIGRLDGIVLSHRDQDHSGGLDSLWHQTHPKWVLTSVDSQDKVVAFVSNRIQCQAGQQWSWDGVWFQVLSPADGVSGFTGHTTNDRGCVVSILAAGHRLLMPADISEKTEHWLLDYQKKRVLSDIVLAPHHGSLTASSEAFVKGVFPKAVIFSVGYLNRFKHPRLQVVERYQRIGAHIWRTDEEGAIEIKMQGDGLSVCSERNYFVRYWNQVHRNQDWGECRWWQQ
jgi:competence protein ComEC